MFNPKGSINNILALVQIMTWRRPGDKPLSEPIMVRLPTHICVTRPQWVNWHMYHSMVWSKTLCLSLTPWGRVTHICVTKLTAIGSDNGLSPARRQAIIWINAGILLIEQTSVKSWPKFIHFHWRKCIWKCRLVNGGHFVSASMC